MIDDGAERIGVFRYAGLFGKAKPNDRSAPESLRTGPGSFRGIGIGEQGLQALTFELFIINDVDCRAIQTRVAPEDRKRDDAPPERQQSKQQVALGLDKAINCVS